LNHRPTVLLPPRGAGGCGFGVLTVLKNCIFFARE
jgi:hypothetical protein